MTTENEAAEQPTEDANDGGSEVEPQTDGVKKLRQRHDQLASEKAELERELAFTKAGIDPDDPKMSYFVKGYDGEMEAEAVRKAALEAGFIEDQEQVQRETELSAHDRMDQASAGTAGQPPAQGDYQAEIAAAETPAEVMKVVAKYQPEAIPQQ